MPSAKWQMKMSRIVLTTATVALLFNFASPAHSGVKVTRLDDKGRFAFIEITGVISKSDVTPFTNMGRALRSYGGKLVTA